MRARYADREQFVRRKRWYHFFRALTVLTLFTSALGLGFVAGLFTAVAKVLPRGEELADIRPPVPTRVLASDGSLLGVYSLPDHNREIVALNRTGLYVANATLAIEDIRFYDHPGIDLRGIARAIVRNIVVGETKEGASTITQQLARNLYLTRKKTITRKLQEMILALELERRYSKDEILETYLNQVYYGSNTHGLQSWGIQMAARNYFGKDAEDVTLAEAALLAGLPKNPSGYNPCKHLDAATGRREVVLRRMRAYNMISRKQLAEAMDAPVKLAREKRVQELADFHAPYFARYVLVNELRHIFGEDAKRLVFNYGIDVYTSLDPRMQKVAEDSVTAHVRANRSRRIDDGALVAVDPQTGLIKAMVGGTDFRKDQFNIVTQGRRQPGSAFKPFVYTTAILHGYTPKTIVYDRLGRYPTAPGRYWSPKNADGSYRGPMPLNRALWLSRNAAAAGVGYDVGINAIIDTAYRMGIKHKLDSYLSTALGASVVTPLEICSGYGTLANGGVYHPPTGILRVTTRDGNVLYERRPRPQRALPTEVADTMQEVMRGVIERGTGRRARCPFPASGKTGTTNEYRDAWFIGFTDDIVAAVWVGNRHNQPMNRTFGGTVPAPIWRDFMLVAQPIMAAEHKERAAELARANALPEPVGIDRSPTPYILKLEDKLHAKELRGEQAQAEEETAEPAPRDRYAVSICVESGDLATAWCPETMAVTYIKGQFPAPPTSRCSVHTSPQAVPLAEGQERRPRADSAPPSPGLVISVCAETGKIATENCPVVLRRRFTRNPPTETCPLHGTY